jgi:putative SOS response-associated peptidase YedK
LTKSSNEQIKEIHHRMPVIIQQSDFDCWLNQSSTISNIKQLVQKDSGLKIRSHVVDHAMNKTEHNNKDIKGIRNK